MRHPRHIILVLLVVALGSGIVARKDWKDARIRRTADAVYAGERLTGILSLYPLQNADVATRNLLAKTLVERSAGERIAYLFVDDAAGNPLVSIGDATLQVGAGPGMSPPEGRGTGRRTFKAPDGNGKIVEFNKPLIQEGPAGTMRLGLRVLPPPLLPLSRLSAVAAVAFLMLSAVIVGYYAILRAIAHLQRNSANAAATATPSSGADVLQTVRQLSQRFDNAQAELRRTQEQNAELSSKLAVAAFEEQQAYRVLDGLTFGVLILCAKEHVRRANQEMQRLLNSNWKDLEDRYYADAIAHEDITLLIETRDISGNAAGASAEIEFKETAPGRFFRASCRPLRDSAGGNIGTLVTVQDITRAKLAESAQEDFIAQVAHELLTPLTSMKTYAEMLMTGEITDQEMQKEFYNTINNETDRLTALIRNLLNVSQMETGSLAMARSIVKADWLLDQCLPSMEIQARAKGIAIKKQLPDVFPGIMGDKELLKVVLINILGNAVKYTPPNGAIGISLLEQDHTVSFEVTDSGCGIHPDDLEHVFQKFYRGTTTAVREQTGSGLGLATAKQIVELHGGSIDVKSTLGKGSCFTVRIPGEAHTIEKQ